MKRTLVAALLIAACGGPSKPPEPAKPVSNTAKPEKSEADIEAARNAGILGNSCLGGSTYGGDSYGCGAFASLTGTGDISSGFDDTNIYGGLIGDDGTDPNATGAGTGTVGTGRYGTIGHGSGTGSGYGVGGGSGGTSAPVPKIKIGTPTSDIGLDKAIIRRYVKRNINKIRYCYEKELLNDAKLSGTVVVTFTISPDGKVTSSTAAGVHADVSACVAAVIHAIDFPKPKGGGSINVSYPFTFAPAGG